MNIRYSDETDCARAGTPAEFVTRPSVPPIYQTAAFDVAGIDQLDAVGEGRARGHIYTRDSNPNHEAFAADVARLEGAEAGLAAASGMGAMAAGILSHVRAGDHVMAASVLYGRTTQLLNHLAAAFGVEVGWFDASAPSSAAKTRKANTKLCIVETIGNPMMDVTDVAAVAAAVGDVPVLVDSTFATPCLFKPLAHGAALVFHSASKYLNGHGDVMLGVIVGKAAAIDRARLIATLFGMNANPFECWLAARGLRTLHLRMARVSATAAELAAFLKAHPKIARVYYPGLTGHGTHAAAARLLPHGFGGMLSFELKSGGPGVARLFDALAADIPFSPTLADARTTVSYPAKTSHKFIPAEARAAAGITDGLVRLSVGLESAADLKNELAAGLEKV
jgi:cystathionine beta-lyase/cystathionine gamma-synthase